MVSTRSRELAEAEELLKELSSWSEEEVENLPKLYRKRAREFWSRYTQSGED